MNSGIERVEVMVFFFSSRRRHTRYWRDWSSDVCSSDLNAHTAAGALDFVLDLVDRLEGSMCQVAAVRMDAGFPEERLLAGLERRGTPYIARLRNNRALDRLAGPYLKRPPGRPPAEPRLWLHELEYQAGPWSRPRRVVLVVKERPDDLLLDHFWLLTSFSAAAMPTEALLAHYRQRRSE